MERKRSLKETFIPILILLLLIGAVPYLIYLLFTDFTQFITAFIGFLLGIPLFILIVNWLIEDVIWGQVVFPLAIIVLFAALDDIYGDNIFGFLKYTSFFAWLFFWIIKLKIKAKS